MAEIDPWALPQSRARTAGTAAGIPGGPAPAPPPRLGSPIGRAMPILVMSLGSLYVVASIVEIFLVNRHLSLLNGFNADIAAGSGSLPADAETQLSSSAHAVNTGAQITVGVYLVTLLIIVIWERRLKMQLGTVGARRAVLNRAGYVYFRAAWLVSLLLGIFLTSQSNDDSSTTTIQDLISHDHLLMVYYGVRALVGAILVLFAFRLMKISEEGFARVNFARVNRDSFNGDAFKTDSL